MTRREAIKTTALATAACATILHGTSTEAAPAAGWPGNETPPFKLPPLPYAFDSLEPLIDAKTMEIHHDRHHKAYVDNLNKAMAQIPGFSGSLALESLLQNLSALPENVRAAIQNNGGGHYNHSLFWQMMSHVGGGEPTGQLAGALKTAFTSFAGFKDEFAKAAGTRFGSGWAWLVIDHDKRLSIESTANQDTPLSANKNVLLGIDVWEHAYYLKYQNRRADYVSAFFDVINWRFVYDRYKQFSA